MRLGGVVLAALLATGCHHYFVPDGEIARLSMTPKAQRKALAIAAQREDGTPVQLRGRSFRVLGPGAGGTHRVRSTSGAVPTGIVLLTMGIIFAVPGAATYGASYGCNNCGRPRRRHWGRRGHRAARLGPGASRPRPHPHHRRQRRPTRRNPLKSRLPIRRGLPTFWACAGPPSSGTRRRRSSS
jgi:hypothetical protein